MTMDTPCLFHLYGCMMLLVLHTCIGMCTAKIKYQFSKTVGVRYSNAFAETLTHGDIFCVDLCLTTRGCFVANYNPGTRTCALVDGSQTSEAHTNWHAFGVVSGTKYLFVSKIVKVWREL